MKNRPNDLKAETRSVLLEKIIKSYELDTKDIGDAVELYYDAQKLRIMHGNKERTEGPGQLVSWFTYWLELGEHVIIGKLRNWVDSEKSPVEAKWAYSQIGIGPVIASGLAAHIDITRAKYVSSLWKFAGLAPGFDKKVKGQKLAYNARLKTLMWKLGESFVKVSGKEGATYGKLYAAFKTEEIERNTSGKYKDAAMLELSHKKYKDAPTIAILSSGRLTDGGLHSRAKRRTVKIFLQHYWLIARKAKELPINKPYVQEHLGHEDIIAPEEPEET